MSYSGYEIAWLFFVYSFLGWVMETVAAALKQKRFVNRGLVNAPLCVIYGIAALAITVFCILAICRRHDTFYGNRVDCGALG